MTYIDGYVCPVPSANKAAYRAMAAEVAPLFREHGALRLVECWGDDVPHGATTDFHKAVQAEDGETVVFSWVIWPSKAARNAGWAALMADPRMKPPEPPIFDGKRMFWGGFEPLFDSDETDETA